MKIRLTRTLPVEPIHGCLSETVWEVIALVTGQRSNDCPRYLFMSEAGKPVVALCHEVVVIESTPRPKNVYTYEEYYEQPDTPPPTADDFNAIDGGPTF